MKPAADVDLLRDDGVVLRGRRWAPDAGMPAAGRMVVVHGLGDHGGRFEALASRLRTAGWDVVAFDQRGHGRSPGRRGVLEGMDTFVDDLVAVREWAASTLRGEGDPVLYAHSFGGLVGLRALQTRPARWRAAVLSAPWLATAMRVPLWKRAAARVLRVLAPDLTIPSGLRGEDLTSDPEALRAWRTDPLVHDRVSAGLAARVERAQAQALAAGLPGGVPVLLVLPERDRVADAAAAAAWARGLGAAGPAVAVLEDRRHEPHNDRGREAWFGDLMAWLDAARGAEQRPPEWVSSSSGRAGSQGPAAIRDDLQRDRHD